MFHSYDIKQNTHPGQLMYGMEHYKTPLVLLDTSCVDCIAIGIAIDFDTTRKIL